MFRNKTRVLKGMGFSARHQGVCACVRAARVAGGQGGGGGGDGAAIGSGVARKGVPGRGACSDGGHRRTPLPLCGSVHGASCAIAAEAAAPQDVALARAHSNASIGSPGIVRVPGRQGLPSHEHRQLHVGPTHASHKMEIFMHPNASTLRDPQIRTRMCTALVFESGF